MNKREQLTRLSAELGCTQVEAEKILRSVGDILVTGIKRDGYIRFGGLCFTTTTTSARIIHNSFTGEVHHIPPKKKIRCVPEKGNEDILK